MTGDRSDHIFAEFLDDYYAECDEHLVAARRALLALESGRPTEEGERLLDDLFRHFHTLKGLSGMVGVSDAEELAHRTESVLRALIQAPLPPASGSLDALIASTHLLEQVIAAHRTGAPPPATGAQLERLAALLAGPESARPAPDVSAREWLAAAERAGDRVWSFIFTPAPHLAARGINVNTIRARLQEAGRLLSAMPRVSPQGQVSFEFLVAAPAGGAAEEALRALSDPEAGLRGEPEVAGSELAGVDLPPPGGGPEDTPAVIPGNMVRVDLARLDDLMQLIGALVVTRSRLEEELHRMAAVLPQGAAANWRDLQDINVALERQLRDLRAGVLRVRLVPVGELFERMTFAVRGLAHEHARQVIVDVGGAGTEIDRFVVEQMMDPLLHLVRNAVSHGIESPDERRAAGKPAEGRLALRASTSGDMVVLEVEDDGRGIDAAQVVARARTLGLPVGAEETLAPGRLLDLISAPGLTTRKEADLTSGRGIGMAIVRSRVEALGGSLALDTAPGRGTRFTLYLPLTLLIVDALIVCAGAQVCAVPVAGVRRVLSVAPEAVTVLDPAGHELLAHPAGELPLVRLAGLFGWPAPAGTAGLALVAARGSARAGLVVDRILSRREIVVQPIVDLAQGQMRVTGVVGATELGDGRVALILDAPALLRLPGMAADEEGDEAMAGPEGRTRVVGEPFILFQLAGGTYGVRSRVVQNVDMIHDDGRVAPVPEVPDYVDGVVLSRGQMIPAVNLRARLGLERLPYDLHTRLVVVQVGERNVGLVVDSAREFTTIPDDAIEPRSESAAGPGGEFLEGIASLGERVVLILDVERVLDPAAVPLPAGEDDNGREA